MQRCYDVLGDITFINIKATRKRINKNLFDAFSYTISRLDDNEYQSLLRQSDRFEEEYKRLFEEKDFMRKGTAEDFNRSRPQTI